CLPKSESAVGGPIGMPATSHGIAHVAAAAYSGSATSMRRPVAPPRYIHVEPSAIVTVPRLVQDPSPLSAAYHPASVGKRRQLAEPGALSGAFVTTQPTTMVGLKFKSIPQTVATGGGPVRRLETAPMTTDAPATIAAPTPALTAPAATAAATITPVNMFATCSGGASCAVEMKLDTIETADVTECTAIVACFA